MADSLHSATQRGCFVMTHYMRQPKSQTHRQTAPIAKTDYFFVSAYRSKRFDSIRKVGAQGPTKIPNLSPCAWVSAALPPVRNQIAIHPIIEPKPRIKHRLKHRQTAPIAKTDYFFVSAYRSKRFDRIRKVGAQRPTKIPNLSPCAWVSAALPPVRNQIAIDPIIETKPRIKHRLLSCLS